MRNFFALLSLPILTALLLTAMPSHATSSDTLIKGESFSSVYYYAEDGKRYVFPNDKTYFSWYEDFSQVVTISDLELASISLGGNVTYRPGKKMVKIQTDPKVYAVDKHGTLRWLTSESVAVDLYGEDWAVQVEDVPDIFFVNYRFGPAINTKEDLNVTSLLSESWSIGNDRELNIDASANGADVQVPAQNEAAPEKATGPSVLEWQSDKSIVKANETFTLSWKAQSAVVCITTRDKNLVQIPFVGRLPEGEMEVSLSTDEYGTAFDFSYFLICADSDWNTVVQELIISKDRTPIVFTQELRVEVSFDSAVYYYQQAQLTHQASKELTVVYDVSMSGDPKPEISNQVEGLFTGLLPVTQYTIVATFKDEAGNSTQRTARFTTNEISFPYGIRDWQDSWYDRQNVPESDRCYTTGDVLCTSEQWEVALGIS